MVTHDPRSAEQAGRRVTLSDGKVVEDTRPLLVAVGGAHAL